MRKAAQTAALVLILVLGLFSAAPAAEELKVESITPSGEVPRLTQVVARFSRDMAHLGQAAVEPGQSPLKLTPLPEGNFRWLDTRTLAFFLDRPISRSYELTAVVPAGVRSLDGAVLAREVREVITTPALEVVGVTPAPQEPLPPRPELHLTLNQEADPGSLAWHTALLLPGGRRLPVAVEEDPAPEWQPEAERLNRSYLLRIAEDLPPSTPVTLLVAAGISPKGGGRPLADEFRVVFTTYGPLTLKNWRMGKSASGGYDPQSNLVLEFSNPVSPKEVWSHLQITPKLEPPEEELGDEAYLWNALSLPFQPRSSYQLVLTPGITDQYGTRLEKEVRISIQTGDLPPILSLLGGEGVLERALGAEYPLLVQNISKVSVGAEYFGMDDAVPALVREAERPWDKKPRPPRNAEDLSTGTEPNRRKLLDLDLAGILGRNPGGGLTLLDVRAQIKGPKKPQNEVRRTFIQVTDLGLALKLGTSDGLAWATSLSTGRPLSGVELQLRDWKNCILWRGQSGENGLAALPSLKDLDPAPHEKRPWLDPQVFLLGRQGDDFSVLPSTWMDELFYSGRSAAPYTAPTIKEPVLAHTLTQLPLYQPGQEVRFVSYIRRLTARGLRPPRMEAEEDKEPPRAEPVEVKITDPEGRVIHSLKGRPDAYGALDGEFQLTASARLGWYGIQISGEDMEQVYAGGFQVASFRPPEFKVGVKMAGEETAGDPPGRVQILADYLFGSPVAEGRVNIQARQEETDFRPDSLEGYAVGDIPPPDDERPGLDKTLLGLNSLLDKAGRLDLELPTAQTGPGRPVRLFLEAKVTDPSEREVGGLASALVHPAGVYLGLKGPLLAQSGQEAEVEIAAAAPDGRELSPGPVALTAYRQVWETVRERGPGGYYRHLGRVRRDQVWQGKLDMDSPKGSFSFTPPSAGTYVVVAEARDGAGRLTRSALYLWASGKEGAGAWMMQDDHSLELVADKKEYRPGDTARLMLQNPFQKATALISLERQGVRRVEVREVEGPAPVVELPISGGDSPGIYLGVLLVRGRIKEPTPGGPDLGRPQVRLGYLTLPVSDPKEVLEVKVETGRETARPGQEITATVRVSRDGWPARAQVTLLAVDERVLTAASDQSAYHPQETFSRLTPLSVLTADMRTQVLGRMLAGKKGDTSAGGGGLGPEVRRDFHPAVFWLARAQTGEDGTLTATFRLPGSLTTHRVVAVACNKAGLFASGEAKVVVKLPLQIVSALPRFANRGDRLEARVLIYNLSGRTGRVHLSALGQGITLTGANQRDFELEDGRSQEISFPVLADTAGTAKLKLSARMEEHQDAAEFSLPVLEPVSLETQAASGLLEPGETPAGDVLPIMLPAEAQPGRGGLYLELAPSLAPALARPAALLREYPWECLEQRLSKAALKAAALAWGPDLGLMSLPGDREAVSAALMAAADFQSGSGGYTFWPQAGEANPFLTAYALLADRQMLPAQAGELAPESVDQAQDFLERWLKEAAGEGTPGQAQRAARALALWVLAERGRDIRSLLEAELADAKGLSPFALACLIQAAGELALDAPINRMVRQLDGLAEVQATGISFTEIEPGGLARVMGSRLRSDAMALWALAAYRPAYPRLDNLARGVARGLASGPALSTQEAVFGLWALARYLKAGGPNPDLSVKVALSGREVTAQSFGKATAPPLLVELERNVLLTGQEEKLELSAQGRGRLFWSARLSYAPAVPPLRPVNAGMSLSRLFQTGDGKPPTLGGRVECLVSLVVPATRHHVVVEIPFPAGLEPQQAWKGPEGGDDSGPWEWTEIRKDRAVAYAEELNPGVYIYRFQLRAVAPGVFSIPPARAEMMYSPEIHGTSPGQALEVR